MRHAEPEMHAETLPNTAAPSAICLEKLFSRAGVLYRAQEKVCLAECLIAARGDAQESTHQSNVLRAESRFGTVHFGITLVPFRASTRRSTMLLELRGGDWRMGERVTQSGRADISRANRLKQALESGAPPAFVSSETPAQPSNGSCAENSCPLPPLTATAVTNAQSAETRLHFFEQMFQALPDGLSIADTEHRVLWANDTFARMFDYSATEVVGKVLESLVVPPDRLAESRWVWEAVAGGQHITLETQRRKKDGSLLDVSVSCAPLHIDGKMAGFYAGYHDISDRRRVEALSSALYRVAEKSSSAHDLQQFFAAVHSIVDELMYAHNFYIALYDPATDLLTFPYFVDEQDSAPPPKKLGHGLTDFLIRAGEPLLATPQVLQAMRSAAKLPATDRVPSTGWASPSR